MSWLTAILFTAALGALAPSQPSNIPPAPAVSQLGGRFASCVAYLGLTSSIADRQGDAITATRLNRLAQGWRAAGYAVVRSSIDPGRTARDEAAFDDLVLELITLQAAQLEVEPQRAMVLLGRAFDRTCSPLAPLQGRLLELMRAPPVAPVDN